MKQRNSIDVIESCDICGDIKRLRRSSITAWIFGSGCSCNPSAIRSKQTSAASQNVDADGNGDGNEIIQPGTSDSVVSELPPDFGERYQVLEKIGQGGMGIVYRVMDNLINKTLAIKVMRHDLATDNAAVRRFEHEAESAAALTHANIVAVYGHGVSKQDAPYLVMDYLAGTSLQQLLKQDSTLNPHRALDLFIEIAEACQYAHEKGVVHRDLKPSNIIITKGENDVGGVKIVDFGIAKTAAAVSRETQNLTQEGEVLGSPDYMSPEQCLGFNVDARSDIYSLGCLMYEALVGVPPFQGSNPIQTIAKHLNEPLDSVAQSLKKTSLPKGLDAVILQCLKKDAEQRYQSMNELKNDLQAVQSGRKPAAHTEKSSRPVLSAGQTLVAAAVITLLSICGYAGFNTFEAQLHSASYSGVQQDQTALAAFIFLVAACVIGASCWQSCRRQLRKINSGNARADRRWLLLLTSCFAIACFSILPISAFIGFTCLYPIEMPAAVAVSVMVCYLACVLALGLTVAAGIGCLLSLRWKISCNRISIGLLAIVVALCALQQSGRISWIPWTISQTIPVFSTRLSFLDQAIWIDQKSPGWYILKAGMEDSVHHDKNAIEDLSTAIQIAKANPASVPQSLEPILKNRAVHFYRNHDYRSALADYSEVIAVGKLSNDETFLMKMNRASCYKNLKEYDKAWAELDAAASMLPAGDALGTDKLLRARAKLHEALGQFDKSLQVFNKIIELTIHQQMSLQRKGATDRRWTHQDWQNYNPDFWHNDSWLDERYGHRAFLHDKLGQKALAAADRKELKHETSASDGNGTPASGDIYNSGSNEPFESEITFSAAEDTPPVPVKQTAIWPSSPKRESEVRYPTAQESGEIASHILDLTQPLPYGWTIFNAFAQDLTKCRCGTGTATTTSINFSTPASQQLNISITSPSFKSDQAIVQDCATKYAKPMVHEDGPVLESVTERGSLVIAGSKAPFVAGVTNLPNPGHVFFAHLTPAEKEESISFTSYYTSESDLAAVKALLSSIKSIAPRSSYLKPKLEGMAHQLIAWSKPFPDQLTVFNMDSSYRPSISIGRADNPKSAPIITISKQANLGFSASERLRIAAPIATTDSKTKTQVPMGPSQWFNSIEKRGQIDVAGRSVQYMVGQSMKHEQIFLSCFDAAQGADVFIISAKPAVGKSITAQQVQTILANITQFK